MSERLDLPAGSTVSADSEAIHFMDSQSRKGEITEYGVAMEEDPGIQSVDSGEVNEEYAEPASKSNPYDLVRGVRIRSASDVYGSRGQVSKSKK